MRYFFLLLFLVCTGITFAQENGEITFEHSCFKQLLVTVKNYGYLKDNGAYGWGIKIKNNYKTPVSFTYALVVGDEKRGNGQPTYVIEPGDTWASDWGKLTLLLKNSSSTEFRVAIWGLCFKGYDCSDENYFDCDGRQIKDKLLGSDWRTRNNQNNTQTNNTANNDNYKTATELVNKLNDLCTRLSKLSNGTNSIYAGICNGATYSANQVDLLKTRISQLENEINRLQTNSQGNRDQLQGNQQTQQAQQAEQQRIAQENARRAEEQRQQKIQEQQQQQLKQQQQYNSSVNQAQKSMQGGDFTGAMQGFANAATSANNSSDKNYATAGAVISGLAGIADIWQKSAKAKRERKEQKAAEQLEADWKKANEFASSKTDDGYESAIKLMLPYANESKLNGAALNSIGIWYWNLKDYTNALNWFISASVRDDINAMFNLGLLYENGHGGTGIDFKTAAEWYTKACDKQYEPACKKASEMNDKVAAAKLELDKLKPVETGRAAEDSITVQTILNRYVTAIGGYEQIKTIKTVEQLEVGEYLTIKAVRGYGQFYQEMTKENKPFYTTVFNGNTGYSARDGKTTILDTNTVARYKKMQPFDVLALPQPELTLGKIESLTGIDCYTIIRAPYIYGTLTFTETYYFSKNTGLYQGMKMNAASKTYNNVNYYFYDDYRSLGGVLFPFSRAYFSSNTSKLNKFTVKEININNPASQEYFK